MCAPLLRRTQAIFSIGTVILFVTDSYHWESSYVALSVKLEVCMYTQTDGTRPQSNAVVLDTNETFLRHVPALRVIPTAGVPTRTGMSQAKLNRQPSMALHEWTQLGTEDRKTS